MHCLTSNRILSDMLYQTLVILTFFAGDIQGNSGGRWTVGGSNRWHHSCQCCCWVSCYNTACYTGKCMVMYVTFFVTDSHSVSVTNTAVGPCKQAVFSQSEALEGDGTETHYTYYPATISDATTGTMVTGVQASDTILSQGTPTGNVKSLDFQHTLSQNGIKQGVSKFSIYRGLCVPAPPQLCLRQRMFLDVCALLGCSAIFPIFFEFVIKFVNSVVYVRCLPCFLSKSILILRQLSDFNDFNMFFCERHS